MKELFKENGISTATFHNWKGKYGGMDASQLKEMEVEVEVEVEH